MPKPTLTSLIILFALCAFAYAGPEAISGKEMKQAVVEPSCPFTWDGFYVGGHAGYGWGGIDSDVSIEPLPTAARFVNLEPTKLDPNPNGFVGGVQFGYNWQRGHFVFGVEKDFSWSAMTGSTTLSPIIQNNGTVFPGAGNHITVHQDIDWLGTLRLRMGFTPVCRLLLYVTGGLADGEAVYAANTDFVPVGTEHYPASFTKIKVGWTAGAGAEYAITHRWSLKLEYLYYDLGDESSTANPVPPLPPFQIKYNWQTTAQTVNAGLNFKF